VTSYPGDDRAGILRRAPGAKRTQIVPALQRRPAASTTIGTWKVNGMRHPSASRSKYWRAVLAGSSPRTTS